ncbi:glycosyltransferase [Loigolactobacillus backii]|uniref:glycosyltransferase n=1 Tax=Loigolactobacillus backii TaxID=375175 RepID=UPI001303FC18|nr:glycosyltransferase [Loigolactobacillus backii]
MQIIENSVTAIVVTYGNRWSQLVKNIQRLCQIPEINELIIVDNASQYNVENKVSNLKELKISISVIRNSKNEGSSGGFSAGLRAAQKTKTPFFLLLDDDNLVAKNALSNINKNGSDILNNPKGVIALYRQNMHKKVFSRDFDYTLRHYQNNFHYFSLYNHIFKSANKKQRVNSDFAYVVTAPYSGLLIPRQVIDDVGYPNKEFYLYVDDIEYTYRMTLKGYSIYIFKNGNIEDTEGLWGGAREKQPEMQAFFKVDLTGRGLYSFRNRAYFEQRFLMTSKFSYQINRFIYLFAVFILFMPKTKMGVRRFNQILQAEKDGYSKNLGINKKYKLF